MANNDAEKTLLKRTAIDEAFPTRRKMEPIDAKFLSRKRYLVLFIMVLGIALYAVMKSNLSIVLTDIAYPKYVLQGNRTIYQEPQVNWNSKQVGIIIGAITYGQIPARLLAGILAKKYGGATIFGCGLFMMSLFVCLTPAGFIEGSHCEICLNWAPIKERARFLSSYVMTSGIGAILSNVVTSFGIHYFNWQIVFFATGSTGIIFSIVWLVVVRNRPGDDKLMSNIERRYLEAVINLPNEKYLKISSYPWKEMLTSKPVWAYINESFCCGWSSSFVIFCLPFYIKDVTKLDNIRNVAVMSSIPIMAAVLSEFVFSSIHDHMRSYEKFMNSSIHRFVLSSAHIGVAISLIIMALWVNFEASLILISFIRVLIGIKYVYYNVMALDVFYRYGGTIKNFTGVGFYLTNAFTPLLAGFIVTNHERSQWSIFFGLIVVFNIFSVLVFSRYGSFELQSWAAVPDDNKEEPCSN